MDTGFAGDEGTESTGKITFEQKWGNARFTALGYVQVPEALYRYASYIGLQEDEVHILSCLIKFKHSLSNPFPSHECLSKLIGKGERTVRRRMESIAKKGFINIAHEKQSGGKYSHCTYDLTPLEDALNAAFDAEMDAKNQDKNHENHRSYLSKTTGHICPPVNSDRWLNAEKPPVNSDQNHRSILTKTTGHICPLNKSLKKDIREEDKIREESRTHFSLSNNNVCKNANLENEELPVEDNSELTTTALSNTATSATFAALISQSSQIDMEKHMTFVPTASDDAWLSSMGWDDLDTGLSSAVTESPAPTNAFTESFDNAFTDSYDHAFPEVAEVRSESITDNSLNANTPALGPKPTPPVDESKKDILSAAKSVVTETVVAKSVVAKSEAAARKLAEAEATQLRKAERAAVAEEKRVAAAAAKAVREAEAAKRGMASRNAIRILCDAMSAAGNPTPDVGGWQPAQRTKLGYLLTTWGEAKYSRATNLFATGERGRRANWYIGKFLFEAADFWETEPFTPAFRAGGANSGVVNGSVVNGAGVKRNGKLPAPVEPTTYYNLDDVTATDFSIPDMGRLKLAIRMQGHATYFPPQNAGRRPESAIRLQHSAHVVQSAHVTTGLLEYQAQDESYH